MEARDTAASCDVFDLGSPFVQTKGLARDSQSLIPGLMYIKAALQPCGATVNATFHPITLPDS
jgi:hypothetical protein